MTRQVALADKTYARLRSARRDDESFSETIERLLDSAKDPLSFLDGVKSKTDPDVWLDSIRADRDDSTVDA